MTLNLNQDGMTRKQFEEGVLYAEDNFKNDNASHLKIDKQLIRKNFDLTNKRILDFGCGMGGMSLWYATNWKCNVYGLDIDKHHITISEHLKNKYKVANVTFEKRNILEKPLSEKERFDYIFMNDVAEHIQYPILEKILVTLSSGLAERGKIYVTYPPWRSPYASHVVHAVKVPWCQFLPKGMLMKMIEKNNQQIVGEEESDLIQAYHGLNHLTHERLMKVINKTNLKVVSRKTHCLLNKLPGLRNVNFHIFPLDFLVTKEFLLLTRE